MAINLAGYLFSDNGTAIQNASITLLDSSGNTEDTVSTSGTGYWSFSEADEDVYDIKIQSGSQIRYIKGLDKITLSEIDVRNSRPIPIIVLQKLICRDLSVGGLYKLL